MSKDEGAKREMIEGPEATENFEKGMKKLFQVPKARLLEAERKYKARQKRKRKKP